MGVVEFPKRENEGLALTCDCGCVTFQIMSDMQMYCADCGERICDECTPLPDWRTMTPPLPTAADPLPKQASGNKTLRWTDGEFARRRSVARINEWADEGKLMLAIGYHRDNGSIHWAGFDTVEEREWMLARLDEMREWLFTFDLKSEADENQKDDKDETI